MSRKKEKKNRAQVIPTAKGEGRTFLEGWTRKKARSGLASGHGKKKEGKKAPSTPTGWAGKKREKEKTPSA